ASGGIVEKRGGFARQSYFDRTFVDLVRKLHAKGRTARAHFVLPHRAKINLLFYGGIHDVFTGFRHHFNALRTNRQGERSIVVTLGGGGANTRAVGQFNDSVVIAGFNHFGFEEVGRTDEISDKR